MIFCRSSGRRVIPPPLKSALSTDVKGIEFWGEREGNELLMRRRRRVTPIFASTPFTFLIALLGALKCSRSQELLASEQLIYVRMLIMGQVCP